MAETTNIHDLLASGQPYVGVPFGVSMRPMLDSKRDVIVVVPKQERLKKNDVGLFTRGDKYVLHRVVKVLPNGYIFWGDNCISPDGFIDEERVIGKLDGVTRKGKLLNLHGRKYNAYIFATNVIRCPKSITKRLIISIKRAVE